MKRSALTQAIRDFGPYRLIVIFAMSFGMLFVSQVSPSDHELNIEPLITLNRLYDNPAYVYPPHALTLMMPFYILGAPLTRVLVVLFIAYFGHTRNWSLSRLLSIYLNPIFIYTTLFTTIDLFIVLIPVLFFERSNRWVRGLLLASLMLKPQLGFFFAIYLVLTYRAWYAALFGAAFTLAHFAIPDPNGTPLLLGWVENVLSPTEYNAEVWAHNPVGPRWLMFVVFPILFFLRRQAWTNDHTIAALLMINMTISPYASFQSVLVAVVMLTSLPLTIVHGALVIFGVIGVVWYFLATMVVSLLPRHAFRLPWQAQSNSLENEASTTYLPSSKP